MRSLFVFVPLQNVDEATRLAYASAGAAVGGSADINKQQQQQRELLSLAVTWLKTQTLFYAWVHDIEESCMHCLYVVRVATGMAVQAAAAAAIKGVVGQDPTFRADALAAALLLLGHGCTWLASAYCSLATH